MDHDLASIRRLVLALVALALLACGLLPAAASAASTATANPTSLSFGSEIVGSTSVAKMVTIANTGPGSFIAVGPSVIGDYAVSGGNCTGHILGQGESCEVEVTFTPLTGGTDEGLLEVLIEGEESVHVPLTGTGQTKKLTVPGSTAFATTTVGGATSEKVLLKNSSETGINVSEVKIEGAAAGDFGIEGSNCAGYIGVGMSCELSVRFSPSAAGSREATLRVISDATPAEYVTVLSGEGAAAELLFEPGHYDFGLVEVHNGSPRTSFNLRNTGSAAVQLSNLEISGPGAGEFWISGSGCWSTTLAPGATCWVEVQFNANQEGDFSAAVSVSAGSTTFHAPLSAEAARPQVVASPAPLTFGPTAVGSRQVGEVTLTDTGRLPVGFYIAIVSGGDVGSFRLLEETCTSNVFAGTPHIFEPGEACRAKIAFEPTEVGARHATVSVFGGGEGALQFSVEGTAVAARLSLTPAARDFGTVALGSAGPAQTFTLRNESGEPQTIDSAVLTGADVDEFQLRGDTCSEAVLAPGASCAVAVRFAPESSGPQSATLRLRGPGGTTLGQLSGEGAVAAVSAATASSAGRGWVSLNLLSRPRPAGAKVTIGRARCQSSQPCTLRVGGLASGRIATGAGLRPGIRGVAPFRLTLEPGASVPITTALPPEFRGTGGARLSVALHWQTGAEHGGGRHSFQLGGGLRR